MSYDNDNYLMFAVDSCSQDVVSSNPYWSMSDSQRAEWKSYSRARMQQQQQEEEERELHEEENEKSNSDDDDDEDVDNNNDDDDDQTQQDAPTPDVSENNELEKPAAKQDKRKMWVTYQAWARQTLKEQHPNQKKFPLSEVNKLARLAWAEDGWAK